jgi:DNA-binding MarR family transcriptional regulator
LDETSQRMLADERWETFGLLREAYLAVDRRVEADLAAAGAPERAITDLVFRLARTPGLSLRPGALTRALSTTSTRTTRIIDQAESMGLVTRAADPSDRRALLVVLTDAGLDVALRYGPVALDAAQRHVHDRLSATQTRYLETILRILRD